MIDWARLNELRQEIGPDDFAEVVDMFLEEADEMVSGLATMAEDDVPSALHFLKGMALNLGLADFALLCQKGETSAAPTPRQALIRSYRESKRVFEYGLAQMVL